MSRPKIKRRIRCKSVCSCFKPDTKNNKDYILIEKDEYQAIKLYDVDALDQKESSKKMNISQPTFGRILSLAHKKISKAIINGAEIKFS